MDTVQTSSAMPTSVAASSSALRIVDIEHRGLQAGPAEQRCLGMPVGVHVAVVVEMVLREIGEHGHVYARAVQPVLRNADR